MDTGDFHWQDGWMFARLANGSVRVRKTEPLLDGGYVTDKEIVISPESWESIVRHLGDGPKKVCA